MVPAGSSSRTGKRMAALGRREAVEGSLLRGGFTLLGI